MKIAVVGGGGREHAIIKALKKSPKVDKIYALPGNGGIAADAECVDIGAKELSRIVDFAVDNAIDYVVVAPDDPLAMGLVDLLEAKGIPAFGPKASAAIIESSKAWSKDMMRRYGIPTAEYRTFDDPGEAMEYVEKAELPVVIKADGLALGKGVIIAESREDAREGIKSIMEDKKFGDSGNVVVIEEFLRGPEVSVLAFTDGNVVRPMISSMDHKRALDGDKGLNTGGMGTIAPNPYYTQAVADECMEKIFLPTIKAMNQEGRTFRGCLYFGLMITEKGPKVIEYNSRFGDPETQVVLPLLQGDLLDIMMACTNGTLSDVDFRFSSDSACCVVAASGGYPVSYKKGYPVTLPDDTSRIYIAGTKLQNGVQVTSGGRVLGVTETALREAVDKAYRTMEKVSFQDMYYRKDIGARALEALEK
jgi:phosphoribosylamine--glycine ligase